MAKNANKFYPIPTRKNVIYIFIENIFYIKVNTKKRKHIYFFVKMFYNKIKENNILR